MYNNTQFSDNASIDRPQGYASITRAPGRAEDARDYAVRRSRGLSIINKVTGEKFDTSTHDMRINRMRRRVRGWAMLVRSLDQKLIRMVMITLTYRGVDEWQPNHVRDFLVRYRRAIRGRLYAYAWVAELQRRGAVHYHVILVVSRGSRLTKPDQYWRYGLTRIETARTPYYLATYTGKEYQKGGEGVYYPLGLRMFAVWVCKEVITGGLRVLYVMFRLSSLPAWLVSVVGLDPRGWPRRNRGGGWLYDGDIYRSPYIVVLWRFPRVAS